jgi:hypothetical protein
MISAWTKHLSDQEEITKYQDGIRYSWQLDKLQELLTDMKDDKDIIQISDNYDAPNWALKQADRNGYLRCLNTIINLLDQRKQ